MQKIRIKAKSKKATSKIGLKERIAIIEQDNGKQVFVVFPELNQCRWIDKFNDSNFIFEII